MNKPNDKSPGGLEPSQGSNQSDQREPYEAPRMDAEELFETLALACGKIRPTTFACSRSPNQS